MVNAPDKRINQTPVRCEVVTPAKLDDPESPGDGEDEPFGPVVKYRGCVIPAGLLDTSTGLAVDAGG